MDTAALQAKATDIRKDILTMITEAGSGHPGGSLSCTDILTALYFGGVMDYDANDPAKVGRDRFILAKGHAAPALYATLAHAGFFPTDELHTLRKLGTRLQGHPDSNLLPGVEVSTGSLGQGLSVAAGLAAGLRLTGEDGLVFTVLGDGECEEGQVWEAAMFAAHQKLGIFQGKSIFFSSRIQHAARFLYNLRSDSVTRNHSNFIVHLLSSFLPAPLSF